MNKRVYIKTVGCQMNVLDSEMVVADLKRHGYTVVDAPEQADCILYNTCSVREHAEEKVYSALGRLKYVKRQNPKKLIGVIGCMAQNHQKIVFQRAPYVDLVVGPGQTQQSSPASAPKSSRSRMSSSAVLRRGPRARVG